MRNGTIFLISIVLGALSVTACQPVPAPPAASVPFKLGGLTAAAAHTDKGTSLHHYTETYERYFFDLNDQPIRIFEIGIAGGGSLEMWQQYFPKATIFAADIENKTKFDTARVKTFIADQAKRDHLQKVIDASGGNFDILLDDGGHSMEQQQVSFGYLFPQVKPGGLYIIEDVHTSISTLWQGYGAALDGSNTTLKMIEDFMATGVPHFSSQFLTDAEASYLDAQVESVNLVYRPESKSLVCIFRKKPA